MKKAARRAFLFTASIACGSDDGIKPSHDSGSGDSGIADTSDSAETGDTAPDTGLDGDGDGVFASFGDCDDYDSAVHPGAEEVVGDGTDQDCDGSDLMALPIGDLAFRYDGSDERMTFGEVVFLESNGEAPAVLMISETAYYVGEYGGSGNVHVFTGPEAVAGAAAGTVLHHEAGAMFGQAVGAAPLADGGRAWLAGFSDIVDYGGFCAWDASTTGDLGTESAEACIPPFDDDVNDRAASSFAAQADLNGDGLADLAIGGMTEEGGERVGAMWMTWGPLDFPRMNEPPDLGMGGFATLPSLKVPGDLDQDGYLDLVLSDESANALEPASGAVYLIPGGTSLPSSVAGLSGVDGERPSANTGEAVAGPDLDGDGNADLCVSASMDDTAGDRAGRVACFYSPVVGRYHMSEAAVSWTAEAPNTFFGFSLSSIDLEGDGDDELAIGAPGDPYFGYFWPGKVYLVDPSATTPVALLVGERGDSLGFALGAGDLDGDGSDDLVSGAPWASDLRGATYVIAGDSWDW